MSDNTGSETPKPGDTGKQWWEKELSDVRQEAASRRVENNTLTAKVGEYENQIQTLSGEKSQLSERATKAEADLVKLRVAIQAGVPGEQAAEFAELLQGDTEEQMKAHAERIRKFGTPVNQRPYDPSAGHGQTPDVPNTPVDEFVQMWSGLDIFKR